MRDREAKVPLTVNGAALEVSRGTTVASAVLIAETATRVSMTGERRAPLCGIGICFECRVTIDGVPHQRSCLIQCRPGMRVTAAETTMMRQSDGRPI